MNLTRIHTLPTGLVALTTTARGMQARSMHRAAQQAFAELEPAIAQAGLLPRAWSWLSLCPDEPQGPDDPDCRYLAGVVFGHELRTGEGAGEQPALPLTGTLAWHDLAPGRYAVFTHLGPYTGLADTWAAIYQQWLPASGEQLRDAPPLELMVNSPRDTPPERLHTEIWIPLV